MGEDDQYSMVPKKFAKKINQETLIPSEMKTCNLFQLLEEQEDHNNNNKAEYDPDEDILYESFNHPTKVMILAKVMHMAKKLSEDDKEIEVFAKWIEDVIVPLMNELAHSVYSGCTESTRPHAQ